MSKPNIGIQDVHQQVWESCGFHRVRCRSAEALRKLQQQWLEFDSGDDESQRLKEQLTEDEKRIREALKDTVA